MKLFLTLLLISQNAFAVNLIKNSDIAASGTANIARNKLAASTAHNMCTFDASGYIAGGVAPGTSGNILTSNGTDWTSAASTAALSVGAFSSTPTAPGLTLLSNVLNMDPADATHPGGVSTTTQTLAGAKTFSSAPTFSTMTIGSILFAGTGGLVSQDNANFFFDDTNNRLGIGQTTPLARLHIKQDSDGFAGGLFIESTTSASNAWAWWASNGNVFRLYNKSLNATTFSVDGQEHFMFGAATTSAGIIEVKLANGISPNSDSSLVIEQSASQTGDAIRVYNNSGPTLTSKITHAGKGFFIGADMGSARINSVQDPSSAQDAATKKYVDDQLAQLNPYAAVYAASTATVAGTYTNAVSGVCIGDTFTTTATTAFALDGTSPAIGSRVLLKNQASAFQNGVWTLTTQAVGGVSGAVLTRALDYDSAVDMNAGQLIPVINGTANANTVWYQTAAITTCNSDSQVYVQFSGSSGGGCVTPVLTKTTDYTIQTSDFTCANKVLIVRANCSSACTMTFPAASNAGYIIMGKTINSGQVTWARAGSDTIDGDTSYIMTQQYQAASWAADGGISWDVH